MSNIFPIDFEEKLTMAQDDYILFSDSEDGNKIKKAQYKNLKGEPGTPGTPGKDGEDGAAATITVGSTTTGAAGTSASVTNSGTSSAAVLDFTIPQGAKGEPGEDGQDGADGAAATITVGTTTTLPAGSSATVTNVGTSQDAILDFGIPKGDSGTGSGDVTGPASSTDGHLAVFDGATGKLIKDGGAIPEGNVKSFTLSSTSDLTTAQEAYDWFLAGKQPIIVLSDAVYTDIKENTSTTFRMYRCKDSKTDNTINGDTLINNEFIYLSISSGTVTSIGTLVATVANVLSTTTNYSNPYTPQYDGSPATKKYVDDRTLPAVGTNGQVLTVVSGAAAWANASGGDVLVSTQAHNLLTTGMKIWAGTEGDYGNIGIYDSNTLYLTVPGGATPGGWTPGANTLAYYKISDTDTNSTIYDLSGNGVDQTWSGTASYTTDATYGRVAVFDGSSQTSASSIVDFGGEFTVIALFKASSFPGIVVAEGSSASRRPSIAFGLGSDYSIVGNCSGTGTWYGVSAGSTYQTNTWYMVAMTRDNSGNLKIYINGTLVNTTSSIPAPNYDAGDNLMIGKRYGEPYLNGQFKLFIGEDKTRTATEIADLATEYGFTVS